MATATPLTLAGKAGDAELYRGGGSRTPCDPRRESVSSTGRGLRLHSLFFSVAKLLTNLR